MKTITLFLTSLTLVTSALAGPASFEKNAVATQPEAPCFGPGFDYGIFGGGFLPRHTTNGYDDALGGGAMAEYFFSEYFGIQVSYGAFATSDTHQLISADLILRKPIESACLAPYALLGGGFDVDGGTSGQYHAGVGIEYKLKSMQNMSLFADGAFYWHGTNNNDREFTLVRLGIKFPF